MSHVMQAPAARQRSLDNIPHFPSRWEPAGFMLRLAKALHTYGVPAYELEQIMQRVAERFDFGLQCLSLPTSITMTLVDSEGSLETYVIRVAPGGVDLDKLRRVRDIATAVIDSRLTPTKGAQQLLDLQQAGHHHPRWLVILCFALVSGALARVFGGGLIEIATAAVIGLCGGLIERVAERLSAVAHILPVLVCLMASLLAYAAQKYVGLGSLYIAIVSGIIVFLPGLTLTIAMAELATQNLVSGTARLVSAGITFVQMSFGVALGTQLGEIWFGSVFSSVPESLPYWTAWLAVALSSTGLMVLFQARWRDVHWMILAGCIAFATASQITGLLGPVMGAFLGAIAVGMSASIFSKVMNLPGAIMVIPGFIALVPGSVGFKSLTALLEHDVVTGLDTAFQMTLVGVALVSGLLLASLAAVPDANGSANSKVKE